MHNDDTDALAAARPVTTESAGTEVTAFRFAIFHKDGGPLSKTISVSETGQPTSNANDCRMTSGVSFNVSVEGIKGFAEVMKALESEQALSLGTIKDLPDGETVTVVTKNCVAETDGAIARTKDYVEFAAGMPGFLLVDFDQKGMPDDIRNRIEEAGGVWPLIRSVFPDLAAAGYLQRASTSAGLQNSETGEEFPGSGGEHIYVAVRNASDIPRATKVLHQRLWLAGLGWIVIGRAGQMLVRSIIDQSVGSPERLVFEGPPVLKAPLVQSERARKPIVQEGNVVDTRSAVPDLTTVEAARFDGAVATAKAKLQPEAEAVREEADERLATSLSESTNVPIEDAREQIAHRHSGRLLPLHPLDFDNPELAGATVRDVLLTPERYVGETLSDPLEGVCYGRNKAMVFQRTDGSLWINSFAHGGGRYDLCHDAGTLREIVGRLEQGSDTETFITALASSEIATEVENSLLHEAKHRTGVNIGDFRARVRTARDAARHRQNRGSREVTQADDMRVRLPVPTYQSELTPIMVQLDEVLSGVNADVPPFRTLDHRLAKVAKKPANGLHMLASDLEAPVAAPAQPHLKIVGDADATMMIEEHVQFFAIRTDGSEQPERLGTTFVQAYAGWDGSCLPRVTGVATLPLVLPGGQLRTGGGLAVDLGLVFDVPRLLCEALDGESTADLDQGRASYRWLCDNWLVDVETNDDGRAVLIALALTVIERHLLAEFPAFFITAAQRGSGKTTALNMISTALAGTMATAASWSFDDEERRKGIFTYLREGASMVVYDNIPRGSSISCPTLERVITSPDLSDRVLGESRSETVPTGTVIAFTGNNITPKGDMASRALVVNLESTRTDPENREFTHLDPNGWSAEHRIEILRHLFNILRLDRDAPQAAKTRFKTWWTLVGHPLELVSGVDFEAIFKANDALDEEAQGATEFLAMMIKFISSREGDERDFAAADVVRLLDESGPQYVTRENQKTLPDASTLKSSLEEASGRPFSGGVVNAHRVAKKLKSIEGRPVEINGALYQLVVKKNHDGHRYSIETL